MPRKSARMSRMNFSSSTMSTRGRSPGDPACGEVTWFPAAMLGRSTKTDCSTAPRVAWARRSCDALELMRLSTWVLLAYGALGALGAFLAAVFGHSPIMRASWLDVSNVEAALASLVLGACGAVLALIL